MNGDGFDREIRFAVVMYGGVSLAVYMNGIAQELLHMVRATAPAHGDPMNLQFRFRPEELTGTERVYRELAGKLRARFVVDIISGTSAGGINGIFLAKALAHERGLDELRRLWVDEGDIGKLFNDKGSVQGGMPPELFETPAASLLNGQRFYWLLLNALEGMDKGHARTPEAHHRPVYTDEIDLFVTATDFQGVILPLALFDKTIDEPLHRKVFHFRYWQLEDQKPEQDDLGPDFNPMLAFAARCTASFPAAFAPFKLEDIDDAVDSHPHYAGQVDEFGSTSQRWSRFFEDYPANYAKRFFVDGGYLDNKPFESVLDALASRHHALLPVDRKLLYVEPDPERHARQKEIARPDLVSALVAVDSLPRVETIRAQIDEITRRNRIYDRAAILTCAIEEDVAKGKEQASGRGNGSGSQKRVERQTATDATPWALNDLGDLVAAHGLAYGGYHRLKVSRMTDWLARCLFHAAAKRRDDAAPDAGARPRAAVSIDDVRDWVVAWRDRKYGRYYSDPDRQTYWEPLKQALAVKDPTDEQKATATRLMAEAQAHLPLLETRLLIDLDVAYRLRRLEFVRLKLRDMLRSEGESTKILSLTNRAPKSELGSWAAAHRGMLDMQGRLQVIHRQLLALDRACQRLELDGLRPSAPNAPSIEPVAAPFRTTPSPEKAAVLLDALAVAVGAHLTQIGEECRKTLDVAAARAAPGSYLDLVRQTLTHFFIHYDDFDLVGFPMLYCLGTDELKPVSVMRVSAADTDLAETQGASKLAGTKLGHFGAFLDAGWRANDILWGRLDGAERIIAAVTAGEKSVGGIDIDSWNNRAFDSILTERTRELAELPAATPPAAATAATAATAAANPPTRSRAEIQIAVDRMTQNPSLPPEKTLHLLGRSSAVIRQVLGGVAQQRGLERNAAISWTLRLLLVVWGVVELAIPKSLGQILLRYWLQLVMLSGGLLLALGAFFGSAQERWVAVVVILSAALLRLLADRLNAFVARRPTRPVLPWLLAVGVVAGAAVALTARSGASPPIGAYGMLDLELARHHDRLATILKGCQSDCVATLFSALRWDFLLIVGYTTSLIALSLVNGVALSAARGKQLVHAVLGAALADVLENGGLWLTLRRELWRPVGALQGFDWLLGHTVPFLTFTFSTVKWALLATVAALNFFGLVLWAAVLARRIAFNRRARARSAGAAAQAATATATATTTATAAGPPQP